MSHSNFCKPKTKRKSQKKSEEISPSLRTTVDFSSKTRQVRREGIEIYKVLKEKDTNLKSDSQ